MSQTIWKAVVKREANAFGVYAVELPEGATLLSTGVQNGAIVVWALVDPRYPTTRHLIYVAGTGQEQRFGGHWRFLGTVFQGLFVWHVFDMNEIEEAMPR